MGSRRLYYRVAARLRGLNLEDEFEFSGSRAALYYDFMEIEKVFERDSVILLSRSAVTASDEIDFKKQIAVVAELRDAVDSALPYMVDPSAPVSNTDADRVASAQKYIEYAEKVLGKERVQELIKNGKL